MSKMRYLFSDLKDHAQELDVRIRRNGRICVVHLSGDVDKYTCSKLESTILGLMEHKEPQVVLGMENVDYIDSSGLRSLVGGLLSIGKQNGELVIFGAQSRVKKALGVTGLSKVLPMFESESDAISSFAMEAELPLAA